jgi:hypothetical protein
MNKNETIHAYVLQYGQVASAIHFCKEVTINKLLFAFFAVETLAAISSKGRRKDRDFANVSTLRQIRNTIRLSYAESPTQSIYF